MGRSAARWMDIKADNLLSTFPKISAGDVGCCYESPSSWKMQDIPGAALACKVDWKFFFFFFLNWEPSIWWSVQQLNNNLKSILLDKQQGVSSLFSVSSSEHLNSVTVKCTQWALFAPVSWAFSHILLQAALTYTCIGALRKLTVLTWQSISTPTLWWHHTLMRKTAVSMAKWERCHYWAGVVQMDCSLPQPHPLVGFSYRSEFNFCRDAGNKWLLKKKKKIKDGGKETGCFMRARVALCCVIFIFSILYPPLKISFTEACAFL